MESANFIWGRGSKALSPEAGLVFVRPLALHLLTSGGQGPKCSPQTVSRNVFMWLVNAIKPKPTKMI